MNKKVAKKHLVKAEKEYRILYDKRVEARTRIIRYEEFCKNCLGFIPHFECQKFINEDLWQAEKLGVRDTVLGMMDELRTMWDTWHAMLNRESALEQYIDSLKVVLGY